LIRIVRNEILFRRAHSALDSLRGSGAHHRGKQWRRSLYDLWAVHRP